MILPYMLRLVCLCFASFFLVHAALGFTGWMAAAGAMRASESMRPREAARFLLAFRMLPGALAILAVGGLCIPSYLWLERNAAGEKVGVGCSLAAVLGAVIFARSLLRGLRALWKSVRHAEQCEREGQHVERGASGGPIVVMNGEAPLMALAGVIRPRIIISRSVLRTLTREEFEAALEHERAHRKSHDNFKRLLLAVTPEIFPFSRAFVAVDRCWARLTEWAADDDAAAGDSCRALSLAAALVRIAQMGAAPPLAPLESSLLQADGDIRARVERLLGGIPVRHPVRELRAMLAGAIALVTAAVFALMLWPATLYSVHTLLEHLLR
ncbi:MAG TPA: M56 family metallopeptidase [Candidatus Acidoferrales bacterium]|nr:M56 family metallopeptidase [Candidatus Acidoferrales bacterium]